MLSQLAQKLFEALPPNGAKIGGITLQRELEISKSEYRKARAELQERDLVIVGGGRGGSLARVEGAELPDESANKKTKGESLEIAREEKKAKSREQRELDEQVEIAYRWAKEKLNYDVRRRSDVCLSYGKILVAIWDGPKAQMVTIPELELSQMRAIQVKR